MKLTIAIIKEERYWIARCLDFMVTQTGQTKEQAITGVINEIKILHKEHQLRKLKINKEQYKGWELIKKEITL